MCRFESKTRETQENESSSGVAFRSISSIGSRSSRQENGGRDQLSFYRCPFIDITRLRDDVMYSAEFTRVCKQAEGTREIAEKDEQREADERWE